jgi:hypothetical protein
MKVLDVPQSGKRGRIVASRNRFGPFHREQFSPHHPGTPAQKEVWGSMTYLSWLWNQLTELQRAAWRTRAREVHSRPRLGQSGLLDGCQLFKKLNCVLATCGRPPLLDPPSLPVFGPNPVEGFIITVGKRGPVFKLRLSPMARADAAAAPEELMVFAWAPCNAGVDQNDLFAFLGLVSASGGKAGDISKLYLKKLAEWRKLKAKRYHVPLAGSKIFIRVCQQVDGWKNELGMFRGSAFVPRNGAAARHPTYRQQ